MAEDNITVSSNWNGIVYTAHASDGKKFGIGSADNDQEARDLAVADLNSKGASTDAPVHGGGHSTVAPEAEHEAAVRAGRTGDKVK